MPTFPRQAPLAKTLSLMQLESVNSDISSLPPEQQKEVTDTIKAIINVVIPATRTSQLALIKVMLLLATEADLPTTFSAQAPVLWFDRSATAICKAN